MASLLPSIPSTFLDFSLVMGMANNYDIKAYIEYDNRMRKKYGPLRYFLYPFLMEKRADVEVRIRYADRQPEHQDGVCRFDCPRCDHFNHSTGGAVRPSPLLPAVWRETVVRDSKGPRFVIGPTRCKFAPTFGIFPYFHSGDGLMHVVSLTYVPIVKTILVLTGEGIDEQ